MKKAFKKFLEERKIHLSKVGPCFLQRSGEISIFLDEMRSRALLDLILAHEREVDVLEEGGKDAGTVARVMRHPAHHCLVHLALAGHQQLVARDQTRYLVPR